MAYHIVGRQQTFLPNSGRQRYTQISCVQTFLWERCNFQPLDQLFACNLAPMERTGEEARKFNWKNWGAIRKMGHYLRPHAWGYALGVLIISLSGVLTLLVTRLWGQLGGVGASLSSSARRFHNNLNWLSRTRCRHGAQREVLAMRTPRAPTKIARMALQL